MESTKCEICGAYTHDEGVKHHGFIGDYVPCPEMDEDMLRKTLQHYGKVFGESAKRDNKTRSDAQYRINKMNKEVQFWKGKFIEVKNENNTLRKKISKQY